jgi:hypothetical protein
MTSRENHQADAIHQAAAIARWDDEGGASMSPRSYSPRSYAGAEVSNDVSSRRRLAGSPADVKVDRVSGEDKKILECLGAAVIRRWATLPTKIQRELFEHATFPADLARKAPPKGLIARFLHNHKDDGDQTPHRLVL